MQGVMSSLLVWMASCAGYCHKNWPVALPLKAAVKTCGKLRLARCLAQMIGPQCQMRFHPEYSSNKRRKRETVRSEVPGPDVPERAKNAQFKKANPDRGTAAMPVKQLWPRTQARAS